MNEIVEDLRAALWSVWNRRWLALAVAWGLCLVGWLAVALFPNSYESKARIFVQLDDVLAEQIGIGAGDRKRDIERVQQTLTSAVNLEKVVRSTAIGESVTSDRQMESVIESLGEDIEVKSEEDNLFEITAVSGRSDLSDAENARLAQDIVQKLIDIFREENLGGSRGEMRETIAFLDAQLAARQKDLETAEQRRLVFESQHPDLIGGAEAISARLASTRAELRGVEADLAAAQSSLAAIEGQLASTPRIIAGANDGGPRAALAQAQSNLQALKARGLTDNHPDVSVLIKQIEVLKRQAAAEGDRGGSNNPAYSSLQAIRAERQANVQSMQARSAALSSEIMSVTASQAMEPGVAAEAQRISRDYDVLRQQYDKLLQDREELRLRGQVETERSAVKFEVIDPPTSPRVPAAPNRPLLLFGVLILGLGAGGGAGFALTQLRGTFATSAQLERAFELPVIGTVSHTSTEATRAGAARKAKLFIVAGAALAGLFVVLLAAEFVQRGMIG
jgi:polysaccharide chain length determinant protein (PEP-CTERM system associated)